MTPAGTDSAAAPLFSLNDGRRIPSIGLGVWQSPAGKATYEAVRHALDVGYRHIDTAAIYGNEADVGRAVRESGIGREEIFVTTKLWNRDQGYDSTLRAFDRSLKQLGLEYVDLYLLHWPVPEKRLHSWKALCRLRSEGKCRSIGVSNYTVRHLNELLAASDVVPAVNQVEFHPFLYQRELLEACGRRKILVEAYSPLTRGERLVDPTLAKVAERLGRTPAQILLRWCLEHGTLPLPKSNRPDRIEENFGVFDFRLGSGDLDLLDGLNEDFRTCWDPSGEP